MQREHKDIIIANLSTLVNETDLPTLVPELLKRNVFNRRMIERILNPSHDLKRQKTDLYVEILKRGPDAFSNLQASLISADHSNLANMLSGVDTRDAAEIRRNYSLTSVGSNTSQHSSDDASESDGPCQSSVRKTSAMGEAANRPDSFPLPISAHPMPQPRRQSRRGNFPEVSDRSDQGDLGRKVFHPPSYHITALEEQLKSIGVFTPGQKISYAFEKNLPVCVKLCRDFKHNPPGRPRLYKMNSNPRGCALVINNMIFDNKEDYPDRKGAENDETRYVSLLKQFHFTVEVHRNKTKDEMEDIVEKFSQKAELKVVDCLWITFMSHGTEGETFEDGEIVGVDGVGYKTSDIVSQFYNDACKDAINKPKLFFFQSCRGGLTDPGVIIPGMYFMPLDDRVAYDGMGMNVRPLYTRTRTHSDIFIAYPTPPGIMANRDQITGAWFIQAVVDVFSEYAKDCHLEDLLKMVDDKIKGMNNLHTSNFQAVTTKTVGWSRHLYFNPGIYKDSQTGATVRIGDSPDSPQSDEGMDVVDASSTSSDKSPNGIQPTYSRLKDDKDEDSDHRGGKYDCFNLSMCRTS